MAQTEKFGSGSRGFAYTLTSSIMAGHPEAPERVGVLESLEGGGSDEPQLKLQHLTD